MVDTPVGKEIEKRQIALHGFSRDVKAQGGGVSADLLLKHILINQDDDAIIDAIVMTGQDALRYEFFQQFSTEIEKVEKDGDLVKAQRLTDIRTRLVKMYDDMREQSNRMMAEAAETLTMLLEAPDMQMAVTENFQRLDDAFMYFLIQRINQADEAGNADQVAQLRQIQELIASTAESQVPPEIRLLNQMLESPSDAEREQILDENPQMVAEEMLQVLDAVQQQVEQQGQLEILENVKTCKTMIRARLLEN